MKNLIVTTGAVILILSIMSFQFQCNSLIREKKNLKFAADEAAATAAMCYEENSFGEGILKFDREKGDEKAKEIIGLNMDMEILKSIEITYVDKDNSNAPISPYVLVELKTAKLKAVSKYEQAKFF